MTNDDCEKHYHKIVLKDKVRRTKDNNNRVRNERGGRQ